MEIVYFPVAGMLSKPGLAVWAAAPPRSDRPSLVADLGPKTVAATEVVPVAPEAPGASAAVQAMEERVIK